MSLILRKRTPSDKEIEAGVVQETAVLSCDFELEARDDIAKSKLVFKFNCVSSVIKTFKLNYDSADLLHATFDKKGSHNTWVMSAKTLNDTVNYFGPKAEHVDWSMDGDGKVTFTSYTEKIQDGNEIIRHPTHTSVQLDDEDFDVCRIEKNHHISVSVKDFRSIIYHAQTMKANVKAVYSSGHRPTQITYNVPYISVEFTLMTKGTASKFGAGTDERRSGLSVREIAQLPPTGRTQTQATSTSDSTSRQPSVVPHGDEDEPIHIEDHHDQQDLQTSNESAQYPTTRSNKRKTPEPAAAISKRRAQINLPERPLESTLPPASANPDNLFFAAPEENDQRWDPPDFDDDGQIVMWQEETHADLQDNDERPRAGDYEDSEAFITTFRSAQASFNSAQEYQSFDDQDDDRSFEIRPTQGPLNGVSGLFDSGIQADFDDDLEELDQLG